MRKLRSSIYDRIILKGGLYSYLANLYKDHKNLGDTFIVECFEQCHNKSMVDMWGQELVLDVIHYRLELIRRPMRALSYLQERAKL